MKSIQEKSVQDLEKEYAAAIMRLRGKVVEAEDEKGNIVQCWQYNKRLYDYNNNELKNYTVKEDWRWLGIIMACVSLWLAHYLITK